MKIKKVRSGLLLGIISGFLMVQSFSAFAENEQYPTNDTKTDEYGMTMTNSAVWADENHLSENYDANLTITINGLETTRTFNEPVDVQIVHDISTSMDYMCFHENHYAFMYTKKITEAVSVDQMPEFKSLIEVYLLNYLKDNTVTGKDNWISIAGMSDKDDKLFSENAYLVPMNSFYMKPDPNSNDGTILSDKEFETRWYIIDDAVSSADAGSNGGYSYWQERYHASKSEDGTFHSLSMIANPTAAVYASFVGFNRKDSINADCKSFTTVANNLINNFSEKLFEANAENHIAINCFAERSAFTGVFTNDPVTLKNQFVEAFHSGDGQTNYEAGLVEGRDSLKAHQDNDDRKKILIFISDGNPNLSMDDEGNNAEFAGMAELTAIADEMKEEGIEIYTVGFCIDQWINDSYLLPMATDKEHSQFRSPDQLDQMIEIYDFMQDKIVEETVIKSIVEDTISQYYTVDKDKLPSEIKLIENQVDQADGSKVTVQKIRYNVNTEDLDKDGINTKVVPLILKEEYRGTNQYYPTNDEAQGGASALYVKLDGGEQLISVKTPWLDVNAVNVESYQIDTEVVNGSISESITNINKGEAKVITYAPNPDHKLKEIYIDDQSIAITEHMNNYQFSNIEKNHKIKVVYEKIVAVESYQIDTEVVNGSISESIANINKGETKVITYSPNPDHKLKEIYIDDQLIAITEHMNNYQFSNIEKNHKIKVVYEKIVAVESYQIDTEVVNGSISESIANIKKGETKVITYSPNADHKLKEIYIDDQSIAITEHMNNYQFSNIEKNHKIKVVYEKNGVIAPSESTKPNDSSTPTSTTRANTPNTGDHPNYILFVAILSLSAGLGVVLLEKKKKRSH